MLEQEAGMPPLVRRVIVNPISGERIVVRESGEQNGGQCSALTSICRPAATFPPAMPIPSRRSSSP